MKNNTDYRDIILIDFVIPFSSALLAFSLVFYLISKFTGFLLWDSLWIPAIVYLLCMLAFVHGKNAYRKLVEYDPRIALSSNNVRTLSAMSGSLFVLVFYFLFLRYGESHLKSVSLACLLLTLLIATHRLDKGMRTFLGKNDSE